MRLIAWVLSLLRETRRHIDEAGGVARSWGDNMSNRVIDDEDGWR